MPELLHEDTALRIERLAAPCATSVRFVGTGLSTGEFALEGHPLPREMNRSGRGESRAMRLGPGEWLLVGTPCPPRERLDPALFAVDVGDGLACFDVRGRFARALLAGASTVDFDAAGFAPATATRTRFARTSAIVECLSQDAFAVYVDRSVASYVAAWFALNAPRVVAAG